MSQELEYHEAANLFPMMSDEEAVGLMEDIKEHGQKYAVELYEGKVLDGRNRYLACLKLGIECEVHDITIDVDDPVVHVLSVNLHRRNLPKSKMSLIAVAGLELQKKLAKERQGRRTDLKTENIPEDVPECSQGEARDIVGKAAGVSGRTIADAAKVKREAAPELLKAVDADRLGVTTAVKLLVLSAEEQRAIATSDDPRKKASAAVKKIAGTTGKRKAKTDTVGPKPGHNLTERFAKNIAGCAITQLKQIPLKNPGREEAFVEVENWIISERIKS